MRGEMGGLRNRRSGCDAPGEVNRRSAAIRILDDMIEKPEPVRCKQAFIFFPGKACVIKRLSLKGPDRFALPRSGREHQSRTVIGVLPENCEHAALILRVQMEKTVPGNQTVKAAAKREFSHIGNHPELFRKSGATKFDQRQ